MGLFYCLNLVYSGGIWVFTGEKTNKGGKAFHHGLKPVFDDSKTPVLLIVSLEYKYLTRLSRHFNIFRIMDCLQTRQNPLTSLVSVSPSVF